MSGTPAADGDTPSLFLPTAEQHRLHGLMEFCASIDQLICGLMPGRFEEGVVLFVIARVSMDDWLSDRTVAVPRTATRSIRVNGIATPHGQSPDTIGRYVRWLQAERWVESSGKGVALSTQGERAEPIAAFLRTVHDLFVRMAADMVPVGASSDQVRPGSGAALKSPTAAAVLTRAMDILLVPLEDDPVMRTDVVTASIWGVLFALTLRGDCEVLTRAPSGVSVRSIASIMALPYANVWRRLRALEEGGAAERVGRGWRVPSGMTLHPIMGRALLRMIAHAERRTIELGWHEATRPTIETSYLVGPPSYAG